MPTNGLNEAPSSERITNNNLTCATRCLKLPLSKLCKINSKSYSPQGVKHDASKAPRSIFGLLWLWSLISWVPQNWTFSFPYPMDHLSQFASQLVYFIFKILSWWLTNGWTDGRTDRQPENIMPWPASMACYGNEIQYKHPFVKINLSTRVFWYYEVF